jgi:hypothetical protein
MTGIVGKSAQVILLVLAVLDVSLVGQAAQSRPKLTLETASLPRAAVRHPYEFQFHAREGTPPLRWEVVGGDLPDEVQLDEDGFLRGTPRAPGEWHFTVGVTDSSRPPQSLQREFVLKVQAPLMLQWKEYANVTGNRIAGQVEVSNSTTDDFDFTLIVLAVNEIGKAFAIGYQHFPLKGGVEELEIPFGDSVPRGQYVVHIDAVGEVPPKNSIYRARLQTKESLPVTIGP